MGQMRVRRTGPWVKISCPFSWVQFIPRVGLGVGQTTFRIRTRAYLWQRQTEPLRPIPLIGDACHFLNKVFLFRRGARPSHTIFAAQLKEYLIKTFFLRILAAIAKYAYMYDVLNNESIAAMINKVAEDLGGIYGLVIIAPARRPAPSRR